MTTMVDVPFPRAMSLYPRLRQTLLASFDACPLDASWKLQHDNHEWSSYPAAAGQLVHRAIAKCVRHMMDHREYMIPVEVALQIFEETLRQHDVPMLNDGEDSVTPIPLRWVAEARVCMITWAMGTELDLADIAGVEQRLEAVITYPNPNGGVVERVLTGKPDLILISADGRSATIPDWKSGWGIPPEHKDEEADEEISDEGYFQQRFYSLLAFLALPGVKWVTMNEHYVRFSNSKTQKPTRSVTLSRDKLPELTAEFSALVERFDRSVEAQVFKPSPGSHCWNCVQPGQCPILPSARREGRVTNPEEADRVAGWINVGEAALRRYREALRPWVKMHGSVAIKDNKRDRVWGPVTRTRTERPSLPEVQAAVAAGVDPSTLYRQVTTTTFAAHARHDQPDMVRRVAEEEAMLLAASKRQESARKGAATRARRRNGGN